MSGKLKRPKRRIAEPAPRSIQASEFKARCLDLMDQVEAQGTELVITKHGRPVAKLVPVDPRPESPFGFLRGTVVAHGDIVGPEHEAWRQSSSDPLVRRTRR